MDSSKLAFTTADRIRSHALAQGVTPGDLADRAGMPYNTLRRYLKGERVMPLDVFYSLCSALRLDPTQVAREAWLLVREQSRPTLRSIPGGGRLKYAAHGDGHGTEDPLQYP